MKKVLAGLILAGACVVLFSPWNYAAPLDIPYQIVVSTSKPTPIVISTNTFPSAVSSVNSGAALSQWCLSHVSVSAPGTATNFTMFWSTGPLAVGTTDYMVTTSTAAPYDQTWTYRTPYCAPVGAPILTLKSSVAASTITVEGYLFRGWNP